MNNDQLAVALASTPAGANVVLEWERPCKMRAAYKGLPLTKRTRMVCRLGVAYDNIKDVKAGRADGSLPAENAGLKGFEWVEYPRTLRAIKTGLLYLRIESGTFGGKAIKTYKLDGQEVAFDDYKHTMLGSEMPKPRKEGNLTFNVQVAQIIKIHKHSTETETEGETETDGETA